MKKMISWNVNGLRAAVGKNFKEVFVFLLMRISFAYRKQSFRKVKSTWNLTAIKAIGTMPKKKAMRAQRYSQKKEPKDVFYGINEPFYDNEGRVITLEFENYFFLRVTHRILKANSKGLNTECRGKKNS